MNYKKKSFVLAITLIAIIQILLLINNRQRSSIRYFIWNIQEISVGKLICVSFISGLVMSSILNNAVNNNHKTNLINENEEEDEIPNKNDYSKNNNDINESNEIPPERDLRDVQPTISVNYRVIKDNSENVLKDRNQNSKSQQIQDDWNNSGSEW